MLPPHQKQNLKKHPILHSGFWVEEDALTPQYTVKLSFT